MAVLIKDMDFPKTCRACDLEIVDDEDYTTYCPLIYKGYTGKCREDGRLPDCPLVAVSDNGKVREIGFAECANALLKMWIDNVVTDGEYNRIESKLHKYWAGRESDK